MQAELGWRNTSLQKQATESCLVSGAETRGSGLFLRPKEEMRLWSQQVLAQISGSVLTRCV